MSQEVRLSCPQCGAPQVLDNPGIVTLVCPRCQATLHREGAALRAGERSIVGEPASHIHVGAEGRIDDQPLRVVGRVRFQGASSRWDEWYGLTPEGRALWLVEDARRYTLESELDRPPPGVHPGMELGAIVVLSGTRFQVDETGQATCQGGEGQLPRDIQPGQAWRFVDLSEVDGHDRLTLEFDAQGRPTAFRGRDIPPDRVRFAPSGLDTAPDAAEEPGVLVLACPHCGGSFAPPRQGDPVRTAVCPYCDSVLSLEGSLARKVGERGPARAMPFAVGAKAALRGRRCEVVGRLVYVDDEGWDYSEYLLWCPEPAGYLWLVEEDGNFTLVHPTSQGPSLEQVRSLRRKQRISIAGTSFRYAGMSRARLEYVDGALPWHAQVGDFHRELEFTAPPQVYSLELSGSEGAGEEMERFIGHHLGAREVYAAFGQEGDYTAPAEAGMATPNPVRGPWLIGAAMAGAFALLNLLLVAVVPSGGEVLTEIMLRPGDVSAESEEFTVPAGARVMGLHIDAGVDNSWIYVEAELMDAESEALLGVTGEEVGYYHGVEGGESWTEGSRSASRYFRPPPEGDYVLAIEVEGDRPVPVTVSLTTGEWLTRYPLLLSALLALIPVAVGLRWRAFERDRWDEDEEDD